MTCYILTCVLVWTGGSVGCRAWGLPPPPPGNGPGHPIPSPKRQAQCPNDRAERNQMTTLRARWPGYLDRMTTFKGPDDRLMGVDDRPLLLPNVCVCIRWWSYSEPTVAVGSENLSCLWTSPEQGRKVFVILNPKFQAVLIMPPNSTLRRPILYYPYESVQDRNRVRLKCACNLKKILGSTTANTTTHLLHSPTHTHTPCS